MTKLNYLNQPLPRLFTAASVLMILFMVGVRALPPGPAAHALPGPDGLVDGSDIDEALRLFHSEPLQIQIDAVVGDPFTLAIPFRGEIVTLDLHPFSNRADDHRVWIQIDDGSLVEVDPGPVNTYRGFIQEHPGSVVSAGLQDGSLHAMLQLADSSRYMIEPVAPHVPGALPSEHVLYNVRDADCEPQVCGVPGSWAPEAVEEEAQGGIASGCQQVNIAIDADFLFYQAYSSNLTNVLNRINSVMNNTNAIYESEVGIHHAITEIVVRTSSTANPYTCPSGDGSASNLLSQFRNVWITAPESQIPRNIAHMFTGCTSINAAGVAYLGAVCKSINHFWTPPYGLARNISSLACATHVTAHELGHNWNATHCTCSGTLMHPTYPPCTTVFASSSRTQITNYLNSSSGSCSVPCIGPEPQPPSNNTCIGSAIVHEGTTSFTNELATTDGPEEPELCNFGGSTTVEADVWFRHTAQCTGDLTISLCPEEGGSADFATKLAVYGAGCPTGPGSALACSQNVCGSQSSVTIPVTEGQVIRIRVGGQNGAEGEGVLSVFCNEPQAPACPADLTGDGVVDIFDLLAVLAAWGPCEGCPEDITGDGVVDIFDLLEVLAQWGGCPQ